MPTLRTYQIRVNKLGDTQSILELCRAHRLIGAFIAERIAAQRSECVMCGKLRRKRLKMHYCKLIHKVGISEARRLRKEAKEKKRKDNCFVSVVVATIDGVAQRALVCHGECHRKFLEISERTQQCMQILHMNKLQLKAIQRYLKTGSLEAFDSLPKEYQPDLSSPG